MTASWRPGTKPLVPHYLAISRIDDGQESYLCACGAAFGDLHQLTVHLRDCYLEEHAKELV